MCFGAGMMRRAVAMSTLLALCASLAMPAAAGAEEDPRWTLYFRRVSGSFTRQYHISSPENEDFSNLWHGRVPLPYFSPTYDLDSSREHNAPGSFSTTVRYDLSTNDAYPLSLDPRFARYIEPGTFTQSDDPQIAELAASLARGCTWESEVVERVVTWMAANIGYGGPLYVEQDAKAVLGRRTGTCFGQSNLMTALLRAAGIPSGVVEGSALAMWGDWYPPPRTVNYDSYITYGGHAWVSVLYPSAGWVVSEPQVIANTASVAHIQGTSHWDELVVTGTGGTWMDLQVVNTTGSYALSEPQKLLGMGSKSSVYAATVRHEAPPSQPVPSVHLEIEHPAMYSGSLAPGLAMWSEGSRSVVWYTLELDGSVIASGGPDVIRDAVYPSNWAYQIPDGPHRLRLTAENADGRRASAEATFTMDFTAPTTTMLAPVDRWRRSNVTVTLKATDTGTGVETTRYRIGRGAVETYTAPFIIPAEGRHTIEFLSVDGAGTMEETQSATILIDKTPPKTRARVAMSRRGETVVELDARDPLSGVYRVYYRVDGGRLRSGDYAYLSGRGRHKLQFYARDTAGNVERANTSQVYVR